MIKNRNLDPDARKRTWVSTVRPVDALFQASALVNMENDIKLLRIDSVYAGVAGAAEDSTLQVGTAATPALYLSYVIADTQAAGVVVNHTMASSAILPAGTPLIVRRSVTGTDAGSTAELSVIVTYELIDRNS